MIVHFERSLQNTVFSKILFTLRGIAVDDSSNAVDMIYYYLFNVDFIGWPFLRCTAIHSTHIHFVLYELNWIGTLCASERARETENWNSYNDRSHWPNIQDFIHFIEAFLSKIMHINCNNENFKRWMGCSIFKWIFFHASLKMYEDGEIVMMFILAEMDFCVFLWYLSGVFVYISKVSELFLFDENRIDSNEIIENDFNFLVFCCILWISIELNVLGNRSIDIKLTTFSEYSPPILAISTSIHDVKFFALAWQMVEQK